MKAVIQRVFEASVTVGYETVGAVGEGFLVLLGVRDDDTEEQADLLAAKTANLRVFCDEEDKMNRSVLEVGGEVLVVSNFTLCADTKKGNRPSFIRAKEPVEANRLYERYCAVLRQLGVKKVATGRFGAKMAISMVGNGPVTLVLDTDTWRPKQP